MSKIKLVPLHTITKRQLIEALLAGRTFCLSLDGIDNPLHWDDNHPQSQVRLGAKPWNWRGMKYLHEIVERHWYNDIPEKGVLCWVSDHSPYEKDLIFTITRYEPDNVNRFISEVDWEFAEPLTAADLYQEQV